MTVPKSRIIVATVLVLALTSIVLPTRLIFGQIEPTTTGAIQYGELVSNEDKLYACYNLIQQAIDEYNRQSDIAAATNGTHTTKFRYYARMLHQATLKELLSEQNRLKELIRVGAYDAEGWEAVSRLAPEDQWRIYWTLYGNETYWKQRETTATATNLTILKAVNLDELPDKELGDPVEDFTTYTEYDEGGDITIDSNTVTMTSAQSRDETFYVYDDKGAAHFDGDYEHRNLLYVDAIEMYSFFTYSVVTNHDAGDYNDLVTASDSANACLVNRDGSNNYIFYLAEIDSGTGYTDSYSDFSVDTLYYMTKERDEAVGSYGTIYLYICTTNYYGEGGSSLVDTLSVTLHTSKKDYQYIYALQSYDTGTAAYLVSGYVEDLDLQETAGPSVATNTTDDVEDTTATLNGDVLAVNDGWIEERGFVWDTVSRACPDSSTSPSASAYDSSWTEAGNWTTGAFDHGVSSLQTATTYYTRAAAENNNNLWGYGDEDSFLTKPAAPTNVAATDGVHTDKIVVSWTKSSGTVTGYKIYRDAGLIDTVGDVATYDDTGADAPTITPGAAVCSDGAYTDKVNIAVTGDSANVGTTHTYKVRAYNDSGDSDDSGTDTGYRGVGSLTYQWWRSSGCANSDYSSLGGATTDPYDDMTAPAPTISGNNATACDGCSSAFVTLSCNETANNGVCRYYYAVLSATGAASANSTSDSGYRGTTSLTYQWWRSAADSDAAYSQIAGGTTDPYNDTGGVVDPDGRYYLTTVSMSGAVSVNSSPDRGYMSSGNITTIYVYPEWQSRFVGLNGTLWAVAWAADELATNQSVVWNTTGVGEILWSENVTGPDGRADCIIGTNATGNQTIGCSGGSAYDQAVCLWVEDSPADLPTWYFVILGVALVGAWFTKEILLYIMGVVACGGMVWWVQNSTLEQETALILTAVFIILGGVMVFGMLRKAQFSFIQGGDSE